MSRIKTITITLGSLAAGAAIATGVSGVALADSTSGPSASSTSSATSPGTSSATTPGAPDGHRGPRDGGHGPGGRGMLAEGGTPLHGQTVVKAADGTVSTISMVRGTVTAVSSTSITVKAEDGFTATFAVNASTDVHTGTPTPPAAGSAAIAPAPGSMSDIAVGDVADVEGTTTGSSSTATEVRSMTAAQWTQFQADRQAHEQAETSGTQAG